MTLDYLSRLGELLLLDDIKDFGKFDRIHHWHIGLLLMIFGSILEAWYLYQLAKSDIPFKIADEISRIIEVIDKWEQE